jgi:hypothetical protein
MHDNEALRCLYCSRAITAADDTQRVSKREVAHTACAFAVNDAFFFFCDLAQDDTATHKGNK